MRRQSEQRGYQLIEDLEAANTRSQIAQRDGAFGEIRGDLVGHVDPDADREPLQGVTLPAGLTQNPGNLTVVDQNVVRPFELGALAWGHRLDDVSQHEPDTQREHAGGWQRRPQQHPKPDAARRRTPRPPVAAPPRRLFFSKHDRAIGRALRAEIVNRVECRRKRAKHAALRNAPAARERRRRNVVDA